MMQHSQRYINLAFFQALAELAEARRREQSLRNMDDHPSNAVNVSQIVQVVDDGGEVTTIQRPVLPDLSTSPLTT